MSIVVLFIGLFLVGFGWIAVTDQDRLWKWHEFNAKTQGLKVDRTPEWEGSNTVAGILCTVFGVCLILLVILGKV